ncbi:MAG TPA: DUF1127 domain-containing protein [Acetobacteraceae bacterium]
MLSYHSTWDDADYEPVVPHRRGWADRLAFFRRARGFTGRMSVRKELYAMSDRELSDIGISRYDIQRVFDPTFAREHASRGL